MKRNEAATQYGLIFLSAFTSLYIYPSYGLTEFLIIFWISAILNLPSLIIVVILYYLDFKKIRKIPKWTFVFSAIVFFIPSLAYTKYGPKDPRNLFPIFEEPFYIILLLCVIAHSLAFIIILLIEKMVKKLYDKS